MVNNLPTLPEEIITEILLRLPVKALLKFRCVSKSWLSLISTPQFIKTHLQISTKNNLYFHNRLIFGSGPHPNGFQTFSLNPKVGEYPSVDTLLFDYYSLIDDQFDTIRIVGSCNGLVCVAIGLCVVLWNPSTRKLKKLPCSDRVRDCEYEYGFGYDESNDEYKVFQSCFFSGDGLHYETEVMVYSSKSDSWRIIKWAGDKRLYGPGVFMNGCIHWKVSDGNDNE